MTYIAAKKTTKDEKIARAKRDFIVQLLDTSWRLAAAFLGPVIIGLWLDDAGSKKYTTIGMAVGVGLALLLIFQQTRDAGGIK
jgi:Na+(H+)/acetate symporter ActP